MEVNNKSRYGTTRPEYHITGFNEPYEIAWYGRGFQGKSCRHHSAIHDCGHVPFHAPCTRMGLSLPGCHCILSRLTMPRTGDWTAIRWNVSPPLILCIRHRTFLLLVLPEREKAIWPVPLDTKHAKRDSVPSMPMLRNCSVR